MKGILFDMDGVLIDSMTYHIEALNQAINEEIPYSFDKKLVYLLEGMPIFDLIKEAFKRSNVNAEINDELIEKIVKRKIVLFEKIEKTHPIEGANELMNDLVNKKNCKKILVSGASRKEVENILQKNIGIDKFDLIITGDDVHIGKPDPLPYLTGLNKMNLKKEDALVIENSPLGVESAKNAGLKYIITLNNSPLGIDSFRRYLPNDSSKIKNILFENTKSIKNVVLDWCCEIP